MNDQNKSNRYRTFGRMVSRGSDKSPAQYAILCGRLTAAEIGRLLSKRGLDDIASITAAGKPLDGLRTVWACYTIAAAHNFATPYTQDEAINASASIAEIEDCKAALNAVNRKITAAKKRAEVIFRANNPEPTEADFGDLSDMAAAREAWEARLAKARAEAETPELREAYNDANEKCNSAKAVYAEACMAFDNEYMARIDRLRAGLSPLKQCGEDNSNN